MTHTGLKIYDFLKRTHVRQTMRFLDESQGWELEILEAYQQKKLNRLLDKVGTDVPFFRDCVTLRQGENENWPILDREMVMEAGDELLSDRINIKKCKIGRTGGTTGPPLRIYRDQETRSWALGAYYRFYDWMNKIFGVIIICKVHQGIHK